VSDFKKVLGHPIAKINVIGTSGTGKSTFAKKLSEDLGIPYLEMDKIFWLPNWTWPTDEAFFSNLKQALDQPTWVLDGNYTRTVPISGRKLI
jgi:adenylate kinase family enzyme